MLKDMAGILGFAAKEIGDLAIVVTELVTNIVIHARDGELILTPLEEEGRLGIRIQSQDNGPGIADPDRVVTDGYSTCGGLGYGLGTVNRLMDEFIIASRPDGQPGTLITCLRWNLHSLPNLVSCPLSFGIATRAHLNSKFNGDSFAVTKGNGSTLVALIDGLGHGELAHYAAQMAKEYVENHYDQPLPALFGGVAQVCQASRGIVMAVARFDWGRSPIRLTFASIGNIEARVFGCPTPINLMAQRGVIGFNAPRPNVIERDWNPAYTMVLHTDGINNKWHWNEFPELAEASAGYVARRLLQTLAGSDDDATVIVVRGSECEWE
jgi:anti-sigma regulatory factor (Ser/Thr protein kinase)